MTPVRVLIIDDSVTMRAMLEQVISMDSQCPVVGAAANAEAAATLIQPTRPDVITLDLAMPGVDGIAFLRGIHGQTHPPRNRRVVGIEPGTLATMLTTDAGAQACFDKANLLADVRRFLRVVKKAARSDARPRPPGRFIVKRA